ncbi:hypothetical protein RHSIM_Rhsim02G0011400 [Rhododendron simsii]|uniref:Uncharacterized protein n=1 Tax=Rhododendron simsii TaxID=118357 RepID=A0A834LU47_RHOSS|nr:hypothetical protein RHSIM_Rhsim02G0011400 [Rhododendron simsii]
MLRPGGTENRRAFNALSRLRFLRIWPWHEVSHGCQSQSSPLTYWPAINITHMGELPFEGLSVLAKYTRPLLVHAEIEQELEGILELEDSAVDPRSYSTYLRTRPTSCRIISPEGGHIEVLSSDHPPSVPELKRFDDDPPHGGQGTHYSLSDVKAGRQVHGIASDSGLDSDPFAQSFLPVATDIVDVLPAVGGLEDLILGSQIQWSVIKMEMELGKCIVSALIDMLIVAESPSVKQPLDALHAHVGALSFLTLGFVISVSRRSSFCAHCMAAFKAHVYFVLQVRNLIAHFLWGKGSCGVVLIKLFWLSLLGVVKCLQSLPGHVLHKSLRWKVEEFGLDRKGTSLVSASSATMVEGIAALQALIRWASSKNCRRVHILTDASEVASGIKDLMLAVFCRMCF